ncbi:MAG TPA: hypothetical protein VFO85_13295 [Vicinamibacteria bacterium]|nr:hypothetical protein [Vicinamibacteria bacterium]
MGDIVQLLEQAVQGCQLVAERARNTLEQIDELYDRADQMREVYGELAEVVREDALEDVAHVDQHREAVATHAEEAGQGMEQLLHGEQEATEVFQKALATIKSETGQVAASLEVARTRVEASVQHALQGLGTLSQKSGGYRTAVESDLQRLKGAFQVLRDALAQARTAVEGQAETLLPALDELGPAALEAAHSMQKGVGDVLEAMDEHATARVTVVREVHEEVMRSAHALLTDEDGASPAETWMTEALAPVREAVAELAALREPGLDSVQALMQPSLAEAEKAGEAHHETAASLQGAAGALND